MGDRKLEESPRQREQHVQGIELGKFEKLEEKHCVRLLGLPQRSTTPWVALHTEMYSLTALGAGSVGEPCFLRRL